MLAVMGGNEKPTADDIKMIIGSVGIESEDVKLNLVIKKLHGKNIEELVAESMYNLNIWGFFCFVFPFVFVFFLLMCNFRHATLNQVLSKIYMFLYNM